MGYSQYVKLDNRKLQVSKGLPVS